MTPVWWFLLACVALPVAGAVVVVLAALAYDEWLHRREQRETDAASDYWRRIGKAQP